jgi:lipid A 3-O-deacylase
MKKIVAGAPGWAFVLYLLSSMSPDAATGQLLPLGPPEYVSASTGTFEIRKELDEYETGWELHFAPRRFWPLPDWAPDLMPVLGAMATSQGTLYGYGGFRAEFPWGKRWMGIAGFAGGVYYRGPGGGKDLGSALEFRTNLELAYRLPGEARLGLCLYHLSNGGIYHLNPGSESLVLTYSVRLRK